MLFRSDGTITSSIAKFFDDKQMADLKKALDVADGDLVLFVADRYKVVSAVLSALRLHMGKVLGLIDKSKHSLL